MKKRLYLEKLPIANRKYDKPIPLYPLKPEEALAAFMKVASKKAVSRKRN